MYSDCWEFSKNRVGPSFMSTYSAIADDSLLTVADESFVRPLTGEVTEEVTEMGDHWIRKLFAEQYHTPD